MQNDQTNHRYEAERLRTALRALMAKLADLLDEDQFAHCENIVRSAGVEPHADGVSACDGSIASAVPTKE